jgi:hypothetical protein
MSSYYEWEDLNDAINVLDSSELDNALKFLEFFFVGKDDDLADYINETVRDDISKIVKKAKELQPK